MVIAEKRIKEEGRQLVHLLEIESLEEAKKTIAEFYPPQWSKQLSKYLEDYQATKNANSTEVSVG